VQNAADLFRDAMMEEWFESLIESSIESLLPSIE
jgi:hypothetical protein